MTGPVPIVDLFSGPGGLAEGFSAFPGPDGAPAYRVALSVEKDPAAHRTLLLRAFLRKFGTAVPPEYYDFLNGLTDGEPDWSELYPRHWSEALDETRCLELGRPDAGEFLRRRIENLRAEHGGRTVLLGGPPCQSYSVAGRARNAGNVWYDPDSDDRQSLYEEYVEVLRQLRPAVAVMENVKGMLSARHAGKSVFPDVMRKLERGSGTDGYRLLALAPRTGPGSWQEGAEPKDFLVHSEEHGVPQTRHRLFVVCIRCDVAKGLPEELVPRLEILSDTVPVSDIIGSMPRLRSRLSRRDSAVSWKDAVARAVERVEAAQPLMSREQERLFRHSLKLARATAHGAELPFAAPPGGTGLSPGCPDNLRAWLVDEKLERLPNNETRAHVPDDLARYLFASAFAHAFGRSPKTFDFPGSLAPAHASWNTGKFADRFRVQLPDRPSTTVTSHLSKDGHYFIHPDPGQVRSLTVREVARLQTFPDNYFFHGSRTEQYVQVGNAVPPFLAWQIAGLLRAVLDHHDRAERPSRPVSVLPVREPLEEPAELPLVAMGPS